MTLFLFFILLFVLIISHECGHFFSARVFGIRVDEFGFGLPPRITGIKRNGILYSLNWLPFGGFVKIHGEEGNDVADSQSFASKSSWVRAMVIAAGVFANMILAWILLSIVASVGMVESLDESTALVTPGAQIAIVDVAPDGSAHDAGIAMGDYVTSFQFKDESFKNPRSIADIQDFVRSHQGETISMTILRGEELLTKDIFVRPNPPSGEGPTGIALSWVHHKKIPWFRAPLEGGILTYQITKATLEGLGGVIRDLARGSSIGVAVAGPIGIFNLVGTAQATGLSSFLMFAAILSINLALINIFPFPGLDGGRLLFIIIERVRGRRISERASSLAHGIGFLILLSLMVMVTYLDLTRIF